MRITKYRITKINVFIAFIFALDNSSLQIICKRNGYEQIQYLYYSFIVVVSHK